MIFIKTYWINLIINYLIISQLIKGLNCLKCHHCLSSNMYTDLDCHVEQKNKLRLKECDTDKNTCVHIKYEGINPKTGDKFLNVVRECSTSNNTECIIKKHKNLNTYACFCVEDGCNKNRGTIEKLNLLIYLFIFILIIINL